MRHSLECWSHVSSDVAVVCEVILGDADHPGSAILQTRECRTSGMDSRGQRSAAAGGQTRWASQRFKLTGMHPRWLSFLLGDSVTAHPIRPGRSAVAAPRIRRIASPRAGSVDRWLGRCSSNLARVRHSIILRVLGALEFLLVHGPLRVLAEQRWQLIGSACTVADTAASSGAARASASQWR